MYNPAETRRKLLLITHPTDYGSNAMSKNLVAMFEAADGLDFEHHAFSADEVNHLVPEGPKRSFRVTKGARLQASFAMRKLFARAKEENRIVVYQGISPALFCSPWHQCLETYIVLDWARKLYEPLRQKTLSPFPVTFLHKAVLKWSTGAIGLTDAIVRTLVDAYNVSAEKVHKGRMPFDVFQFQPNEEVDDSSVRMLFVGGQFHQKGGDRLLHWYQKQDALNVELTIVTQMDICVPANVRLVKNDPNFSPVEEFNRHDLFVLPTRYDAFPMAIGEAASAGLGIITTNTALGAQEVIDEGENGFIVDSEAGLHAVLDRVTSDRALIQSMKRKSRAKMEAEFTFDACFSTIEDFIFSPS